MQENRPFDHHFGYPAVASVDFSDPRAVNIHLPLQSGTGTTLASVFLSPRRRKPGARVWRSARSGLTGGPSTATVISSFRVNPAALPKASVSLTSRELSHSWGNTHRAWNQGQYDSWAP